MTIWNRIPDFDHLSWDGAAKCFNCGSTKRPTEEGVFRPQNFDDISGFPDICEGCMTEAAAELGLVASQDGALKEIQHELSELLEELRGSRDALATLTRENVRLQELIDDLSQDFDTVVGVYSDDFEDDDD